jgi:hypothetical protein
MITLIRTTTVQPGKIGEAMAWSKEIVGIAKRITGKEATLCTSIGGVVGGLAWIVQYDNLGQLEDANKKILADREYLTAISKAADLFVPGSGHDQIWRHA